MSKSDSMFRFVFETFPLRGVHVSLDREWQHTLALRHDVDDVISLLGELTAATLLMGANIKGDGRLITQLLHPTGRLSMAVVEYGIQESNFRALVRCRPEESEGSLLDGGQFGIKSVAGDCGCR